MRTLLLITFILSLSPFQKLIANEKVIADFLQKKISKNTPGGSFGVFQNGKTLFYKNYGLADLEKSLHITGETRFRIASTSKQFTAACIYLLEEEKKLKLDETLFDYFPEFGNLGRRITLDHLIHHTSGLIDYSVLMEDAGLDPEGFITAQEVLDLLTQEKELYFEPGEEFEYCNSNYFLLGQIVKIASGMSLSKYAELKIFKPLKMTKTVFLDSVDIQVPSRAKGYFVTGSQFKISITSAPIAGDGGLFSTVQDLNRWNESYFKSTFSKSFWSKMTTPGVLNSGVKTDYAGGLGVGKYKGHTLHSHAGSWVGFKAQMYRFPRSKLSIIILVNRTDLEPSDAADFIADLYLNQSNKAGLKNSPEVDPGFSKIGSGW